VKLSSQVASLPAKTASALTKLRRVLARQMNTEGKHVRARYISHPPLAAKD
jgi:hypothetical protein